VYRIQDTGYRYRIQDTGYRIQDTGYRIQDTGYRIQGKILQIYNNAGAYLIKQLWWCSRDQKLCGLCKGGVSLVLGGSIYIKGYRLYLETNYLRIPWPQSL
jgi:hypothetical protein